MTAIPSGINRQDVLSALTRLDRGAKHPFGPSTKFDLVHEGKRYPPKAVVGLAAERLAGAKLEPADFSGGKESQCNRILEDLGFAIERKPNAPGRAGVGRAAAVPPVRFFTHYWRSETWDGYAGRPIPYTAGNGLRKRGLQSGDRVYIVTNRGGQMYVGGYIDVQRIVDREGAHRLFGRGVWNAQDFVVPTGQWTFQANTVVPLALARRLLFLPGKVGVGVKNGRIDQQTLRNLREITPESAHLLEELLGASSAASHRGDRRQDPEAAGRALREILRSLSPDLQSQWIAYLAEVIEYAGTKYPDRWVLALHRKYVSFIVGMVMCLQLNQERGVTFLLDKRRAPGSLDWNGREYKNAPGCEEASLFFDEGLKVTRQVRNAHRAAMDICGGRHAGTGSHRQAHSPGLLRYLETVVGRSLPDPSYARHEATEQEREAADLAADQALAGRGDLPVTEKEALRKYRCAQGLFRDRVAALEKRCRVTGVDDPKLLRASHIRPWKDSTPKERQDGNNGLFLAPHVDALFDAGLISFSDKGELLKSSRLPKVVMKAWGIPVKLNVGTFSAKQCQYLKWHRKEYGFG